MTGPVRPIPAARAALPDPPSDDDAAQALYALNDRGFEGVDEDWEWDSSLLAIRCRLETAMLQQLRGLAGVDAAPGDVPQALRQLVSSGRGPSLSAFLAADGTVDQMGEFVAHRSAYQLKEADPHTWAIPRLTEESRPRWWRFKRRVRRRKGTRHAPEPFRADHAGPRPEHPLRLPP